MNNTAQTSQKVVAAIHPFAGGTGTYNSIGYVDTLGWQEVVVVVAVGTTSGGTLAIKLQESDTTSGATDITGATMSIAQATHERVHLGRVAMIDYASGPARKRYLNVNAVVATAAFPHSVSIILRNPVDSANASAGSGAGNVPSVYQFNLN
jgi:hypothetical protein